MSDNIGASQYPAQTRNPFSYEKVEQTERDTDTAWLTLEEIQQQLNLFDDTSQDTYLSSVELATRFAIEDFLGLSIFPISYRCYYGQLQGFNTNMALDLPEVNEAGIEIDDVSYYTNDPDPVLVKLDKSAYFYDPTGNRVIVSAFPNETNAIMANPILVDYTTKSSVLATYPVIKQAGLMLLTHLYNNRSNSSTSQTYEIPFGVAQLLRPYKPLVL